MIFLINILQQFLFWTKITGDTRLTYWLDYRFLVL